MSHGCLVRFFGTNGLFARSVVIACSIARLFVVLVAVVIVVGRTLLLLLLVLQSVNLMCVACWFLAWLPIVA